MAIDCISAEFETGTWTYCWDYTTPEPSWKAENVTTGLRKGVGAGARAWRTCQYYMKGLPSVCKHWSGAGPCGFTEANRSDQVGAGVEDKPSGFNNGLCDNLGRRSNCNKYEASVAYNPEEWICTAPNGYLTGLGKRAAGQEAPIIQLLSREDILGYNDDGNGVGLCDCYGMGRGKAGCGLTSTIEVEGEALLEAEAEVQQEEEGEDTYIETTEDLLLKMAVACNYYRPWTMGFGALTPRGYESVEEAVVGTDAPLEIRLPMSCEVANARARFQKCNWWDSDYGSEFIIRNNRIYIDDDWEGNAYDGQNRLFKCTCPHTGCEPFNTLIKDPGYTPGVFLTYRVQADGGGLVCNGARPECPLYSGKWLHCTYPKMSVGMPVTANQILELRFWTAEWDNFKEYEKFFLTKTNTVDPATSDLYTFTKWTSVLGSNLFSSRMIGKRLNLCFPIPIQEKEFTEESILVESPITYAPPYIETGTTHSTQIHFPTLLRKPEFEEVRTFSVAYPPFNDEPAGDGTCDEDGGDVGAINAPGHLKRHNNIYGDTITVVGTGIRDKKVYAINTRQLTVNSMIKDYASMRQVPENLRSYITNQLIGIALAHTQSATPYATFARTDPIFGYYVMENIKIDYGDNTILFMIDYGDGNWEFKWRLVHNVWCGGIITQNYYRHEYPGSQAYTNTQPESISPGGEAQVETHPMGGSDKEGFAIIPVYSFAPAAIGASIRYYSYSIIEEHDAAGAPGQPEVYWDAVGGSNAVVMQIQDLNLNYLHDWDLDSATMVPTDDKKKALLKAGLSTADVEMRQYLYDENDSDSKINRHSVPPDFKLIVPVDKNVRWRFLKSEWTLECSYHYRKMITTPPDITMNVIYGAGKTDLDRYRSAPYELEVSRSGNNSNITNISTGPIQVMALFEAGGRLISAMATKVCVEIVRESCRNIDIFYRYSAEGKKWQMNPYRGFCIASKKSEDTMMHETYKHVEIPDCADHDYSDLKQQGPMWFPFNACRGYDMYDEFTVCNNCQAGYVGPDNPGKRGTTGGNVQTRYDFRYCGPHKFKGFGDTRGNWLASCDCGCKFSYSDAENSTVTFEGLVRKRAPVDLAEYSARGWTFPPFGNEGRELIEKYISEDYISHFKLNSTEIRQEWMPMVMDNSSFYFSFNAFDTNPEDISYVQAGGLDTFRFTNQMSFFINFEVGEGISMTEPEDENGDPQDVVRRVFRFDDIFNVATEGNCSHPLPVIQINGNTKVNYYYFTQGSSESGKDIDFTWAWQDYWTPLSRNIQFNKEDSENYYDEFPERKPAVDMTSEDAASLLVGGMGHLDFIEDLWYPLYVFSLYKEEHRLVCTQGLNDINYSGPSIGTDGTMDTTASISLNGLIARPFQLLYGTPDENGIYTYVEANYGYQQVTWLDQGGQKKVGGSSDEDSPYEKAMGSEWLHDENILFESGAALTTEDSAAAGRAVVTGLDIDGNEVIKYYNRGININLPRRRLDFLPKIEKTYVYSGGGQWQAPDGGGGAGAGIALSTSYTEEYEPITNEGDPRVQGEYVWRESPVFEYSGSAEAFFNIYKVVITGLYGQDGPALSVKPGIDLTLTYKNGDTGSPRFFNSPPNADESTVTRSIKDQVGDTDLALVSSLDTYTIEVNMLLGPIEMLSNPAVGFTLTLEVPEESGSFISIQSMSITSAELAPGGSEVFASSERLYYASKFDMAGGLNIDAFDNLNYQLDLFNAGLYFPFRGSAGRPSEIVTSANKTKAAYAGIRYDVDERLEANYGNLHELEKEEQKKLYEYAAELNPSLTPGIGNNKWFSITPPKAENFSAAGIWPHYSGSMTSEVLPWEQTTYYQEFKQYEFWRPGGHFYRWADNPIVKQKCMLFGGTEDVMRGEYVHVEHLGIGNPLERDSSRPIDPGNSYYSLRFYTQQAKYDRFLILSGGEPEYNDQMSSATPYNVPF